MAKHTEIRIVDDLDGSEGAETVRFGYEGRQYEVDLSEGNKAKLHEALALYISAARKVGSTGRPRGHQLSPTVNATPGKVTNYDRAKAMAIREWARKHGFPKLANRGRIPAEVIRAWENKDTDPLAGLQAERDAWVGEIADAVHVEAGREALARGEQGPAEILDEHDRDHCPDLDHCPQHGAMVALNLDPDTHNVRAIDSGVDKGKAKPKAKAKPIKSDAPLPTEDNIWEWVSKNNPRRKVRRVTAADRTAFMNAHMSVTKQA